MHCLTVKAIVFQSSGFLICMYLAYVSKSGLLGHTLLCGTCKDIVPLVAEEHCKWKKRNLVLPDTLPGPV